jgi:hypothetical protein
LFGPLEAIERALEQIYRAYSYVSLHMAGVVEQGLADTNQPGNGVLAIVCAAISINASSYERMRLSISSMALCTAAMTP